MPSRPHSALARFARFELGTLPVFGLLLGAGIFSGLSYLYSGLPTYGDVWPHLVRLQATWEAIRAGRLPDWSFFFYQGYPLLRFYSPLFYYLAAPFNLLVGANPFTAAKIFLFLLHVGSGFTAYGLARRLTRSRAAAFIAAACYLFSYWHVIYVNGMGRYPVGLIYLLMPLNLLLFDRLLERPDILRAALAGLSLALFPLTHVFYALFWLPFLLLWLGLRGLLPSAPKAGSIGTPQTPRLGSRHLPALAMAAGLALLASAFFIVPFAVEGPAYRMPQPPAVMAMPSLATILGLSRKVTGYSGAYVGLGMVILAAAGIVGLFRRRAFLRDALFWSLLLAGLLSFGGRLVEKLPMVSELSSERFLVYALLFLALLAGFGYRLLRERLRAPWLWLPVLAVLLIDSAPRFLTDVYRSTETFLESRVYVYGRLFGRQTGRVLDLPIEGQDMWHRYCSYPAAGYLFAGLPSVFGPPYHQFAPRSMLYAYAWTDDLAREFLDSTDEALSNLARQELRLLATDNVVTLPTWKGDRDGVSYVFLKKGLLWDDTLLRTVLEDTTQTGQPLAIGSVPDVVPVIISSRVQARADDPAREPLHTYYVASDWHELPGRMGLDPVSGVAERIITVDLTDSLPTGKLELKFEGTAMNHEVVALGMSVNRDCYARLAFSYYPEITVRINGRETRVWETADHYLLVRLPAGRHQVLIEPRMTPIRTVTGAVSAVTWLLSLATVLGSVLVRYFRSRKHTGNPRGR